MKLSACLVIRNEDKYLERCLSSIYNLVDEIIVIHDGPCDDNSLLIARKYKASVYVRPFIGEAEYHRPYSYQKARGDWILQIDADEFLPKNSKKIIEKIIDNSQIDAYSFWWPYSDNNRYITRGPFFQTFKPCLFRKKKMYMIGISHDYPRTYGKLMKLAKLHLEHLFDYGKYSNNSFKEKWDKWARLQARQIWDIRSAPNFNIKDSKTNSIYQYYEFMKKFPVISVIKETAKYLLIIIIRGILWSGFKSYKIAWYELRYLWLVRKYLCEIKYGTRLQ